MSYTGSWKLVFNTAGKAQEVRDWLTDLSNQNEPESKLVKEMLTYALDYDDNDVIEFSATNWDLEYWNKLIDSIDNEWYNNKEVDYASARIGENYDDNDFENGNYTVLCLERKISNSDLSIVPKITTNPCAEVDIEPEEPIKNIPLKCTCGCGGVGCSSYCDLVTGKHSEGAY